MKNKPEVLAPTGSLEALEAAVFTGADAVYMGGKSFGARASAKNFTHEEIAQAVQFCHARNVAVHMTVNTLVKDSEMQEALDFVRFLCDIPVDAVIVQDIGLWSLIRKSAPELNLHASTQMSLHNAAGVKLMQELGASRAVLARELSAVEIAEINEECSIELESFVHGALCMCVSGQCYFSAMLGSRSGNRGMCAQPCRLPFSLENEKVGNALSLKDLSAVNSIEELKKAGVSSLKIEGRMKRPEYVAAAVSVVRKAVDGDDIPRELTESLEAVFSRSGFTNGYIEGRLGKEMFGVRTKQDVREASPKLLKSLRGLYHKERQSVGVDFVLTDESLQASTNQARVSVSVEVPEKLDKPIENKLSAERCEEQLAKTGGTPFLARGIDVPKEGVALTISQLNELRRKALAKLLDVQSRREPISFDPVELKSRPHVAEKMKLRAAFRELDQLKGLMELSDSFLESFERIFLPISVNIQEIENLSVAKEKIIFELPRAIFGREAEEALSKQIKERIEHGYNDFACGNLGAVEMVRELGANVHGMYSLNVANTASLHVFKGLGATDVEVSMELTLEEIEKLGGEIKRGVMLYGHQALMLTRNCPVACASADGCRGCKGFATLTDRKGVKFPVVCGGSGSSKYSEVLNSVPLSMSDRHSGTLNEVKNVDFGILRFTIETPEECKKIVNAFKTEEKLENSYTRGLLYRGVK